MVDDLDRRVRIVRLDQHEVLDLFRFGTAPVSQIVKLPADAYVLSVHEHWPTRSFEFLVRSAEFDVVPIGNLIPVHK